MRKLMILAAMLAMVLVAASPAFAQATAISGGNDVEFEDSFNDFGEQSVFVGASQVNTGDANAVAIDDSEADASIDQDLDVSVDQVSSGFGSGGFGSGGFGSGGFDNGNGSGGFGSGGFDDDFDGDGIFDEDEFFFDGDLDDDGILDEFDWVILYGDWDNDGVLDDLEF